MPTTPERLLPAKLSIDPLAWDSQHFQCKMGCLGHPPGLTAQAMSDKEMKRLVRDALDTAERDGYQCLMARAFPMEIGRHHALEACGFRLMDTLVTWELMFHHGAAPPVVSAPQGATLRQARVADVPALMALARRAFADRTVWLDRFHADPRIPSERADEVYAQWVKNSVAPDHPDVAMANIVWVAEVEGVIGGFLTARVVGTQVKVGIVPLNAVDSPYRRRGVYRALAETAVSWCRAQGCDRVQVRTSSSSFGVHRTWQRLGAALVAVEHTFHWWA